MSHGEINIWGYAWQYAPGVAVGRDYSGYIEFPAAHILPYGTVTITPYPEWRDRLTLLDVSIVGYGKRVEFTLRNTGPQTVYRWGLYISLVLN